MGIWEDIKGSIDRIFKIGHTNGGALDASGNTAERTYTLPDKDGTVALLDDITGGSGATNLAAVITPTQITVTSDTGTDAVLPAADSTNAGLMVPAQFDKLALTSGTNTGDQDLSGLVPKTTTVNGHALSTNVTVSKGDVGLGNADNTSDANKPVSTAQQTALDLKADLASPTFTGTPAAPTAAGGTSTTQIATTAFVRSEISSAVAGQLEFKGATDCSSNPNYPAADKGDAYIVSVAGKIGGASGTLADVGDWFIAQADNAGGTEASVGASWAHLEHNLAGALLASNNLSDVANAATALGNLGGVAATRTVNGHALSADVTVTKADVSLGNVTDDAQTKAAIMPNTAPSAGQLVVGNAGGTAYAPVAVSGDATLASTGALTLANSGASAGTYGDATHVPQVTVNAKGLVTGVTQVAITGGSSGLTAVERYNLFGDGADGNVTVSSGTTTLTRNMYYNDLTINGTGSIDTAGFQIFVAGTLDITAAPASGIKRPKTNGPSASGVTAGASPTLLASGTLGGSAGSAGTAGGNNGGTAAGSAGTQQSDSNAVMGGRCGAIGAGGAGSGGAGGAARAKPTDVAITTLQKTLVGYVAMSPVSSLSGGLTGGGGAGGGGDGTSGGGGGSGGVGGGVIEIRAKTINRGGSTAAGAIEAKGGNGGNGGVPAGGNRGGGAAGSGAGGGFVIIVYETLLGSTAANAIDVSGGDGGTGGAKTGTGTNGAGGDGGDGGRLRVYDVTAFTITDTLSVSTGAAASGVTGGSGGSQQYSL
jgi:hypothetical protein